MAAMAVRAPRVLSGAVLMSLLLVTGCDGGSSGQDDPTTPPTIGGLTAPGTVLGAGDVATVTRADGAGTIEVTVLGIDQGDPADLRAIGYAEADEVTPYYLRVEVTPVSGSTPFGLDEYFSMWAGENPLGHLMVLRPFPACQEEPVADGALGQSRQACLTYAGTNGGPAPDHVYFDNNGIYETGDDAAVEWRITSTRLD